MGPSDTTATQLVFDIGRDEGFVYSADSDTHVEQVWETGLIHFLPGAGRRGAILLAGDQLVRDDLAHRDARRAGAARHSIRAGLADRPGAEQIRRIGA